MNALFAGLVDDAALFPPRRAGMEEALDGHRAHRNGPHAALLGRFLCPASRQADLQAALTGDDSLRLGLIVDTGLDGLDDHLRDLTVDERIRLELVEVPLPPDADLVAAAQATVAALPRIYSFVELPRTTGWREALDVLAVAGRGAKLRTGGTTPEAFPDEAEVAAFLYACVRAHVPFKCTAGLHHAVRHRDPGTGFEHHGFLNLLLATAAAVAGAQEGEVAEVVAERDPAPLVAAAEKLGAADADVARTRARFVSYGSCCVDEPVHDLVDLGLLQ